MNAPSLELFHGIEREYAELFTTEAKAAPAKFNPERRALMETRMRRRAERARTKTRIAFLDPESVIPRTGIMVRDAREGKFSGPAIPHGRVGSISCVPWSGNDRARK